MACSRWDVASAVRLAKDREAASVDLAGGTVTRWSRGTVKAPEHTVFPFDAMPNLAAKLQRQREHTRAVERETSSVAPWVFHKRGRPIKSLRAPWAAARSPCWPRAGIPPGTTPCAGMRAASRAAPTCAASRRAGWIRASRAERGRYSWCDEGLGRLPSHAATTTYTTRLTRHDTVIGAVIGHTHVPPT